MPKIIILVFAVIFLTGCATYRRAIESARESIEQLEQSAEAREVEFSTLEGLFEAERKRNSELQKLTDDYTESERRRLEAEREIINNLEGILESREDILSKLIAVTREIRNYILSIEEAE